MKDEWTGLKTILKYCSPLRATGSLNSVKLLGLKQGKQSYSKWTEHNLEHLSIRYLMNGTRGRDKSN